MFFGGAGPDYWGIFVCDSCGYSEEEQVAFDDYPCPECEDGIMHLT